MGRSRKQIRDGREAGFVRVALRLQDRKLQPFPDRVPKGMVVIARQENDLLREQLRPVTWKKSLDAPLEGHHGRGHARERHVQDIAQ